MRIHRLDELLKVPALYVKNISRINAEAMATKTAMSATTGLGSFILGPLHSIGVWGPHSRCRKVPYSRNKIFL